MNNSLKIEVKYFIAGIICIIMAIVLPVIRSGTNWTQACEFVLGIYAILATVFIIKSKILDGFKKHLIIFPAIIVVIIAVIYFVWKLYLWPIMALMLGIITYAVYKQDKNTDPEIKKIDSMTKQLICLILCFVLLFSIDSYYRQTPKANESGNLVESIYAEFETLYGGEAHIGVYEHEDDKFGDYFNVWHSIYVSGKYSSGSSFKVVKEEGIKYETPKIVNQNVYAEVIIKREGMDALVYVFPYYSN